VDKNNELLENLKRSIEILKHDSESNHDEKVKLLINEQYLTNATKQ